MNIKSTPLLGWQVPIITDSHYGKAKILNINNKTFFNYFEDFDVVIVAGFQGTDNKGNITSSAVAGINNIPGTPYSSMYIMTSSCIEIFPNPSIKNNAERSMRPKNSTIYILIFFYKFF